MSWLPVLLAACGEAPPPPPPPAPDVAAHCAAAIGPARVETVLEGRVHVAIGYDLANTILVETEAGHVVIDAGMTPGRAERMRADLLARAPGPVAALVLTHSHIDHVGGASAWVDPGVEVWGTEAFAPHFFEQYGRFQGLQARRGVRQFGRDLQGSDPCSALGALLDWEGLQRVGPRLPTRTFSGRATLELGGVHLELVEAHGETDDQLFVWMPEGEVLFPGDNYYAAFPNLGTLRGSRPRPVDDWIASLDAMRRLDPAILVPSHTAPVVGRAAVRAALRDYRDAIQWVRDEVVRGANEDLDPATLAARVRLPPHLAAQAPLAELYGQVDWGVQAVYAHELGWFSGRAQDVRPLPPADLARRTIDAMGGAEAVQAAAAAADDPAWALHLLGLLRDAGAGAAEGAEVEVRALEALAAGAPSTNARAWLLQSALERREGVRPPPPPAWDEAFLDSIPLAALFEVMVVRLDPAAAAEVEEAVAFRFTDSGERFVITVRRGVAELVAGEPLPGGPSPVAELVCDGPTWRRVALGLLSPAAALAEGRLRITGDPVALTAFLGRFERG